MRLDPKAQPSTLVGFELEIFRSGTEVLILTLINSKKYSNFIQEVCLEME